MIDVMLYHWIILLMHLSARQQQHILMLKLVEVGGLICENAIDVR